MATSAGDFAELSAHYHRTPVFAGYYFLNSGRAAEGDLKRHASSLLLKLHLT
jgi:hypothetical protein